jgi:hypothetical protein
MTTSYADPYGDRGPTSIGVSALLMTSIHKCLMGLRFPKTRRLMAIDMSTAPSLTRKLATCLPLLKAHSDIWKSGIGISGFLRSCAWDFHIPDPRLCRISRHVPQLTDGSDLVGQSRIAIYSCKSFLPLETPILRWSEILTFLLMSNTRRAKING